MILLGISIGWGLDGLLGGRFPEGRLYADFFRGTVFPFVVYRSVHRLYFVCVGTLHPTCQQSLFPTLLDRRGTAAHLVPQKVAFELTSYVELSIF